MPENRSAQEDSLLCKFTMRSLPGSGHIRFLFHILPRAALTSPFLSREKFMPPVDPDNEQFVIYVRSKKGFKAWFPLNVVTGGSTANTLVKGLDSNLSRDMAKKSLTNNIGQAIYKDADQLQEMCRRMPMLKAAKELEYGFMILDKKNPSSMFNPPAESVFVIPPEDETRMPAQKMAEGWQSAANTVKNILGSKNSAD